MRKYNLPVTYNLGVEDYTEAIYIQPTPVNIGAILSTVYSFELVIPSGISSVSLSLQNIQQQLAQSLNINYLVPITTIIKYVYVSTPSNNNIYVTITDNSGNTVIPIYVQNGCGEFKSDTGLVFTQGYIVFDNHSLYSTTVYINIGIEGIIYNPEVPAPYV